MLGTVILNVRVCIHTVRQFQQQISLILFLEWFHELDVGKSYLLFYVWKSLGWEIFFKAGKMWDFNKLVSYYVYIS